MTLAPEPIAAPDDPSAEDAADVRRTLAGDTEAFGRLVGRHQGRVGGWLRHFSRDSATLADLVQETFVEAFRGLAGFRGEGSFGGWLKRIAVRAGWRYWEQRDARKRRQEAYTDYVRSRSRPEDAASPAEAAEYVHSLLAELPTRDRLVLTLLHLEEHSVEETAQLLGWSTTMVRVQTHRARAKLKKRLESEP